MSAPIPCSFAAATADCLAAPLPKRLVALLAAPHPGIARTPWPSERTSLKATQAPGNGCQP